MADLQTINIGDAANDGTGDAPRTAFDKVNDNFEGLQDGSIELVKSSFDVQSNVPNAPNAGGFLFVRLNAGKAQLCARFPTGAVQNIATEP